MELFILAFFLGIAVFVHTKRHDFSCELHCKLGMEYSIKQIKLSYYGRYIDARRMYNRKACRPTSFSCSSLSNNSYYLKDFKGSAFLLLGLRFLCTLFL